MATVTRKGQLTIPKAVRDALGLNTGDKVECCVNRKGEALLRPVTKKVDDVFGRLRKAERRARSVEEMDAAVRQKMKAGLR